MPVTTYAIIYATGSRMIRRAITDDEGQISMGMMADGVTQAIVVGHSASPPSFWPLLPGESALIETVPANAVTGADYPQWLNFIQSATGVVPAQLTCAVIDVTNMVQGLVMADPAIDVAPAGFTMVLAYSPQIAIGCTYNPATGLFTAPGYTLAAGVPGNKGSALPKTVPPAVIAKP